VNGVWHVVRWEVMRNLRNKQFLIGMLVTPLMIFIFSAVPRLLESVDAPSVEQYAVVDRIGGFPALERYAASESLVLEAEADEEKAAARVRTGDVKGYLVLDEAFVQTGVAVIYSEDGRARPPADLRAGLTRLLQESRIERSGVDRSAVAYVTAQAVVEQRVLADEGRAAGGLDAGRIVTAAAMAAVLLLLIFSSGAMLLQSALQEKRDRMSEVVLSSINAKTLMTGKIVGHLILGAIQIGVWAAIGLPIAALLLDLPVARWIAWDIVPVALFFFLAGYLFYAALFVGAGATMDDIQSAGNAQGLVFMLPFTAVLFIGPVINNPEGIVSRIGTFLPLSGSFIILLRLGIDGIRWWEMLFAAMVLIAATFLVVLLAARLFRVGMLMYGKSATPKEIWRWLRHG